MKSASAGTIAFLNSFQQPHVADLFTFTLKNGNVYYYTNAQFSIVYGGNTYLAGSPIIERDGYTEECGFGVSTLNLTISVGAADTISFGGNSMLFLAAVSAGIFDQAMFTMQTLVFPGWSGNPPQPILSYNSQSISSVLTFVGRVGPVPVIGRQFCKMTIKSLMSYFDSQFPIVVYQASCNNTLGDPNCKKNLALYTFSGAVTNTPAAPNSYQFDTNLTQAGQIVTPTGLISLSVGGGTAAGYNFNPAEYFFGYTLVSSGGGESALSPIVQIYVPNNHKFTATMPTIPGGYTANLYVGLAQGSLYQQTEGLTTGSTWTMPPDGIYLGGSAPPLSSVGYFDMGYIIFTSGLNNGLKRMIQAYGTLATGSIQVIPAFPNAPSVGDTFTATAGCDLQMSTCQNKFNNLANFTGFPFMPLPENGL